MAGGEKGARNQQRGKRRRRISQADVPRVTLEQALRVPRAIADSYAKQPTRPLDVAAALEMSPTSGPFRELCGAAIGYGLTDGGPNASQIALTDLGRRIVAPLEEGDDHQAMREAVLVPTVERKFLEQYDGSPLPVDRIAFNVLENMGVPGAAAKRVLETIVQNATEVGLLKSIKDKVYVDLGAIEAAGRRLDQDEVEPDDPLESPASGDVRTTSVPIEIAPPLRASRKVFVSHGRNRRIVDQLKELLTFGDFEAVVSVDRESTSKPVPQKVLEDMRSSAAGILHVSPEARVMDSQGEEVAMLNPNVLIEIGAAMALYGDRFILLVEEGTTLPSNLQGLYEVRYTGDELGYEATMKVLKALNSFKTPEPK